MNSKELFIRLTFLEPYRIVELKNNDNKERSLRGKTFAQWLIQEKSGKGSPWIIGTLLRSAVIRSAEELLSLTNGSWNGEHCCNGEFITNKSKIQPKHLRKRHIVEWDANKSCSNEKDACPYCILIGRKFDKKDNKFIKAKERRPNKSEYPVHFENLHLQKLEYFGKISDIAIERTLNRVDPVTGKALDYFSMYEVVNKNYWTFFGKITISEQKVEDFLENVLMFIDKICGAQCKIDVSKENNFKSPSPVEYIKLSKSLETEIEQVSEDIIKAFDESGKLDKVRVLADTVRMMRIKDDVDIITKLPLGRDEYGHFLWDKIKINGKKLRNVLDELVNDEIKQNKGLLKKVYEELGQKLYEKLKKEQHKDIETIRPLGENENYSEQNHFNFQIPINRNTAVKEFIFTGTLVAQTPFYFGINSEAGDQTNLQILLSEDGHYRIPRSVLRGALRRDLKLAFDNEGCDVDLGPDTPCDCKVCNMMRKITITDTENKDYTQAPDIRNRIRMNPFTATVDEEALFDMEVGPEGLEFNFVLRHRGTDIPSELFSVVHYWEELALLGGSGSTGKGRFALKDLKIFSWNLSDKNKLTAYIDQHGGRGNETEFLKNEKTYELNEEELITKLVPFNEYLEPRWKKVVYTLEFSSPLLTADPIAALIEEGNHDSIAYKKRKVLNGKTESVVAIKAETFRGLVRTTSGKRTGDLEIDHEECTCKLCSIFGNEHKEGKIRFEDLVPISGSDYKKIDHVAIDRFHGGAEDSMKFDSYPLIAANSEAPLMFEGTLWIRKDLAEEKDIEIIKESLYEISKGLFPVGGKNGTGYGWISNLEIIEAPSNFKLQESFKEQEVKKENYSFTQLPELAINENSCYYPHYFLKQERVNDRKQQIIGHEKWYPEHFSGKISCTLNTLKPLIIPDSEDFETEENGHNRYKFFNINGEVTIPGSEIRGLISNVYEAFTESCYRIFDEAKYISWRMKPEEFADGYKPGIVINKNGKLTVIETLACRLPLYDNDSLIYSSDPDDWDDVNPELLIRRGGNTRWEKAINANNVIAKAAADNIKFLKKHLQRKEILEGKVKVNFYEKEVSVMTSRGQRRVIDKVAILTNTGRNLKTGYIKLTGPNNAEVEVTKNSNSGFDPSWNVADLNISLNSGYKLRPSKNQKFPRPYLSFTEDAKIYNITKRCERIFLVPDNNNSCYEITDSVRMQYNGIRKEYEENRKRLVEQFTTVIKNDLKENDLVYFHLNSENQVDAIIPVCISRKSASKPLGKKISDDLRPCEREWIEDYEMPPEYKTDPMLRGLRRNFLLHEDGYCPACRLFGTTYFRGRLNFGFAHLERIPKWENNGDFITLPLLEKPRPTWSIPNDNLTIPGRKFYLHHDGWKEVINNQPSLAKDKNKNNRSVQVLSEGNTFVFDIYFQNLEKKELGLLLYALELEKGMAHKLGMGKPLGFGSVKIDVTKLVLFNFDKKDKPVTATKEFIDAGLQSLGEDWYIKLEPLRKLLILPTQEVLKVKYPKLEEKDAKADGTSGYSYEKLRDEKLLTINKRIEQLQTPWFPWLNQGNIKPINDKIEVKKNE